MSTLPISVCHDQELTLSTAYTDYCIHSKLHHPNIDCLPLAASLSSLSGPCCTQSSTFPQLRVTQSIESQFMSHVPLKLPPPDWPPPSTPTLSLNHGGQLPLQPRLITATKWISNVPRSQPPSVSPNSLDFSLQVRTTTASKCVSKPSQSQPPGVSPN